MLDASPATARADTCLAIPRLFISTTVGLLSLAQALCAVLSGDPAVISSVSVPLTDIGMRRHLATTSIAEFPQQYRAAAATDTAELPQRNRPVRQRDAKQRRASRADPRSLRWNSERSHAIHSPEQRSSRPRLQRPQQPCGGTRAVGGKAQQVEGVGTRHRPLRRHDPDDRLITASSQPTSRSHISGTRAHRDTPGGCIDGGPRLDWGRRFGRRPPPRQTTARPRKGQPSCPLAR